MQDFTDFFSLEHHKFHALNVMINDLSTFLVAIKNQLSEKTYIATIDLQHVSSTDDLFSAFADAFRFPDYFGFNWAAFDECINDLEWLSANSYVLVLKNIDKLKINNEDKIHFIRILKNTSEEWKNGRNYDDFPTLPTPFHILFFSEAISGDKLMILLRSYGINGIEIITI
jgi:RNAse (barnase) inhibitor barstar